MKLLLDTHVFLWIVTAPEKVSQPALDAYHDRKHEILLSVVSAWEAQIKRQIGKLRELTHSLREIFTVERERRNVRLLGVELDHVFALGELPLHHRDPFDRLLVAQAIAENAKLVTADPDRLWRHHDGDPARRPVGRGCRGDRLCSRGQRRRNPERGPWRTFRARCGPVGPRSFSTPPHRPGTPRRLSSGLRRLRAGRAPARPVLVPAEQPRALENSHCSPPPSL